MAQYKTIVNFVNLYDADNKVIDYLPVGTKLEVLEIVRLDKDRKVALLADGTHIISFYRNIEAIASIKKGTKKK